MERWKGGMVEWMVDGRRNGVYKGRWDEGSGIKEGRRDGGWVKVRNRVIKGRWFGGRV